MNIVIETKSNCKLFISFFQNYCKFDYSCVFNSNFLISTYRKEKVRNEPDLKNINHEQIHRNQKRLQAFYKLFWRTQQC